MELIELKENEFRKFAYNHEQASFLQTISWAKLKESTGWESKILGFKQDKKIVAATILLAKKTPIKKKMFYAPRGFILDYNDYDLLEEFTKKIKEYVKKNNGIFFKIDPYVRYHQRDKDGNIIAGGLDNTNIVRNIKKLGYKEKCSKPGQQTLQAKWMYGINLKDKTLTEIMNDMTSKLKSTIRKNEKNGVYIREGSYDEVILFKKVIDETANRRSFISRSLTYYQQMYKLFNEEKLLKLYFIEINLTQSIKDLEQELSVLTKDYDQLLDSQNKGVKINANTLKSKEEDIERLKTKISHYEELRKESNQDILLLGAVFYFLCGNEVLSFAGGEYAKYLEFQPFCTLHYEMLKYALDNNYSYYNFYTISSNLTPKDPTYGVYLFKKAFGGEVVELIGEYDYVVRPFYYLIYEFSYKVVHFLKKIKVKLHL